MAASARLDEMGVAKGSFGSAIELQVRVSRAFELAISRETSLFEKFLIALVLSDPGLEGLVPGLVFGMQGAIYEAVLKIGGEEEGTPSKKSDGILNALRDLEAKGLL
jgi:hypothetical protein